MNGIYVLSKNDISLCIIIIYALLEALFLTYGYIRTLKEKKKISRIHNSIENAIISIFTKNEKLATKSINSLKNIFKFSDNNSLITWLDGCNKLAQNKVHEAKAIFYSGTYSNTPLLSGYSLYKICDNEQNNNDSYNTLIYLKDKCGINNIPKESVYDLIKYQLINREFESAREAIKYLKDSRLLGISYLLENNDNVHCLELAYKHAKEIPTIALNYSEKIYLINSSKKSKRKILLKSWKENNLPELFDAIIETIDKDKQINFAKSIVQDSSFEGLFKLAELLYNNELYAMALNYFKKAFAIYHSEECVSRIVNIEDLLNKHSFDASSVTTSPHPKWCCSQCGNINRTWETFCPVCNSLDSIRWTKSTQKYSRTVETKNKLLSIQKL